MVGEDALPDPGYYRHRHGVAEGCVSGSVRSVHPLGNARSLSHSVGVRRRTNHDATGCSRASSSVEGSGMGEFMPVPSVWSVGWPIHDVSLVAMTVVSSPSVCSEGLGNIVSGDWTGVSVMGLCPGNGSCDGLNDGEAVSFTVKGMESSNRVLSGVDDVRFFRGIVSAPFS